MRDGFRAMAEWLRRRRRRRMWRYVSPRRRWLGMLLLALLLTVTYGYWRLTNDARIRRVSQRYLGALTGARVKVESAEFSLFSPIRLRNVRVFFPSAKTPYPFFHAKTVMLRHTPWSLLTRGRVDARELVCIEPVVTFEIIESPGGGGEEKFEPPTGHSALASEELPAIRLRGGKMRVVQVTGEAASPEGLTVSETTDLPMNLAMLPEGKGVYGIPLEGRDARDQPIRGKIVLDLAAGKYTVTGRVPSLPGLQPALPSKYRAWLAKYALRGGFDIDGKMGPDQPAGGVFRVKLGNLSLRLPEEEGGVRLVNVRGTIEFRQDRVILEDIVGSPEHAPETRITLSGTYEGYEPTSDFVMRVRVDRLALPSELGAKGNIGHALAWLRRECAPEGDVAIGLRYRRKGGTYSLTGLALPGAREATYGHDQEQGRYELGKLVEAGQLAATYRWFPYRLTRVTGQIHLSLTRAHLVDVQGQHGKARFTINGWSSMVDRSYDITVRGDPSQLHDAVREAMPEKYAAVWKTVNPAGWLVAEVHARRGPADKLGTIGLKLRMKGGASIRYREFPYPLENITGSVLVEGDTIRLDQIEGWRGKTRCVINGTVSGLQGGRPHVDVLIDATDVPLDAALREAMQPDARAMFDSLHATGAARRISVHLHQEPGKAMGYSIRVWPDRVRIKPDGFPYELREVTGSLTLTPGVAQIKQLRGTRGQATVNVDGTVYLRGRKLGLDLDVAGRGVTFDDELAAALPAGAREAWRRLSPRGLADVDLAMRSGTPEQPDKDLYTLTVRPKGMTARFGTFPYPLENIHGKAVRITPGRVELTGLTLGKAPMAATLDGTITTAPGGVRKVALALHARRVPVDEQLIRALPAALSPLTGAMRKGGTCELNFKRLAFTVSPARPGAAGEEAVTNVEIDARISLDRALFGGREFTRLEGHLLKAAPSPLIRIQDIAARVYGGKVSGFGRIKTGAAAEYGLSAYLENVNVAALVNAGIADPRKRTDMQGLLTGDIKITGQFDKPLSRQGAGVLHIHKAKIYKLPVLLGALQVVFLALPGDTAFTSAHVNYQIRGEKLVFREIFLAGRTLSMVGSGTMSLKTQRIAIVFLTGKPGKMPRMENLLTVADQVLRFLAKELMQIEVSGTLKKPIMRTVPLRSLDVAIRRLLTPDRPDR